MVYVADEDKYCPSDEVPEGRPRLDISGTELRERLAEGREIPEWFSYPDRREGAPHAATRPAASRASRSSSPACPARARARSRTCCWSKLLEDRRPPGHDPRRRRGPQAPLVSELGFSKEHRDINIRRIGYVASEITKHGGIAICAPIAPYDQTRKDVRAMIEPHGGFILVHVATRVEECEARDRKGLYAKARAGIIKEFTGISDPYEEPADAEMVIDTADYTAEEAAQEIILYLEREGYVGPLG